MVKSEGFDLIYISTAVLIFAVYLRTLSPSIAGGDSGELVSEGCHLGTAHPPGYPLLTMLVYALRCIARFIVIGESNTAYWVNLSSALFTTVSASFIGLSVRCLRSTSSGRGDILAMGLFSFSRLVWQYAVTAEVFPLNTLMSSIIVYLTVAYTKTRSTYILYLGSFLCGLAICNQHTIILFEVPLILWMLIVSRNLLLSKPLTILHLAALFLVGLSPYLYLPISEISSPKPGSWGDLSSLSGFLHHFLRKDYGTFQLFSGESGRNAEGFLPRTHAFVADLSLVQAPPYIVPGLFIVAIVSYLIILMIELQNLSNVSLGSVVKKSAITQTLSQKPSEKNTKVNQTSIQEHSRPKLIDTSAAEENFEYKFIPLVLLLTLSFYLIVFHSLANLPLSDKLLYGVHQRFWMQPNVIVYIMVGLGFDNLIGFVSGIVDSLIKPRAKGKGKQALDGKDSQSSRQRNLFISVLSSIAVVTLVSLQLYRNYSLADQSDADYFSRYAEAIMDPLPQGAILFINYDMQWTSVRYKHICEQYRPDLTIINLSMMTYPWFKHKRHLYPHLIFPGEFHSYNSKTRGGFTMVDFLWENMKQHRVFLSGKFSHADPNFNQHFELVPLGIASEILPHDLLPKANGYQKSLLSVWKKVLGKLRFPSTDKYPEETWEWTIGRDFKNRLEGSLMS
jgi:hypothetical protein